MSNYPDDMPPPRKKKITMVCDKCGRHWEVDAVEDFGLVDLYDPDDAKCPNCGAWSE